VIRCAVVARVSAAGLCGDEPDAGRRVRAGLGAVGLSLSGFLTVGLGVLSQLAVPWQWAPPAGGGARTAMVLMTAAALGLTVLALLGALPVAAATARAARAGRGRALAGPLLAIAFALAVLLVGGQHFGRGWPGTDGHRWPGRDLLPPHVAAFLWAATGWLSAYWAHPALLLRFPAAFVAWMLVCPLAIAAALAGTVRLLARLELSRRALRCEAVLALGATAAMAAFLAGAGSWILSSPARMYAVGTIDFAALAVMTVALLAASGAARRVIAARGW
jgi:hypothetical protein